MKTLHWIFFVLLVVGGLNWGLVGFFNFDLVATLFGDMSMISRTVYGLVGISAIGMLLSGKKLADILIKRLKSEISHNKKKIEGIINVE